MHATFGFIRELDLDAWSVRSNRNQTGVAHPAGITITLTGPPEPDAPRVTLTMTVDEAEQLSGTLTQLVADARQAEYSEPDHEPELLAEEDLRHAWNELIAEDIDDDDDDETSGGAPGRRPGAPGRLRTPNARFTDPARCAKRAAMRSGGRTRFAARERYPCADQRRLT